MECSTNNKHGKRATHPQLTTELLSLEAFASLKSTRLTVATLVFDSATSPAQAGVRNGSASARQLLYKAGTVCIDLHVQPRPGSESIVVIGQLVDSSRPIQVMSGVPVSLIREGNALSSKQTNEFGEFDFGLDSPEELHLAFGLNDTTLVVPVPDTGSGHGATRLSRVQSN